MRGQRRRQGGGDDVGRWVELVPPSPAGGAPVEGPARVVLFTVAVAPSTGRRCCGSVLCKRGIASGSFRFG